MGALLTPAVRSNASPAPSSDTGRDHELELPRGFVDLDERILSGSAARSSAPELRADARSAAPSLLIARVSSDAAASALERHALRRWTALHASPVRARAHAGAPLFRDLAIKLKVALEDDDPAACAEKIAAALASRPLISPKPWVGTWDHAVLEELARIEAPLTIFLTCTDGEASSDLGAEVYEIGADLDADAQRRWFAAAAEDAQRARSTEDLAALDAWWSSAEQATVSASPDASCIPVVGMELFVSLALAARAWPIGRISHLASSADAGSALAALTDAGAVTNERGWIAVSPAWADVADSVASSANHEACGRVADAILTSFDDPWSLAVAADLLVRKNDVERAEATHALALSRSRDSLVRHEIVARWSKTTTTLPAEARLAQCIRAGMRSLDAGEADEAFRWAKAAASIDAGTIGRASGKDAAVSLLLGQSAVATGDFVTARVALEKAREMADASTKAGIATRELIAAELSEIAYATEDFETATKEAHAALPSAVATTRLKARNTLGKVLLAQSKWEEAEAHFADDVCYAVTHRAQGKQAQVAELRARLNRGIAILSRHRIEEAKAIFESVLHDGELLHEPRACAFAYENLAVAAMWRHDYGDALSLIERACKLRNSLGDRVTIAYDLENLAQLRIKLGLFDQADHAVTFGRRALGPGMPLTHSASFSIDAARLALIRGRTVEAQREIARAIAESEAAGYRSKLAGDAYRLATRIALEDGDVARARANLAKAESFNTSDESRAEIAYLKAAIARAAGEPDIQGAEDALLAARALGEEELLREAHVLLFELHRTAGDFERARTHLEQAVEMRDQIARVVSGDIRAAFLARPDVVALTELQARARLADEGEMDGSDPRIVETSFQDESPRTSRSRSTPPLDARQASAPRELVGDDPAIRGLRAAIKKVAKSDSTILIRGESGTGKELVAEALHRASDRANGPLVSVNCAALVETLLLSELFGHEKGAFTGAAARRRGRFEMAEGGTLFLDEIGDISPRTQVALLRVLQERTFERVGGTQPIRANVRIVCATHRDLKAMVERGEFREDLYYRLRGITLEVPALRQRLGDLPRISESLLARIAVERSEAPKTLSPQALQLLARHRWPGNVRELENALRAATLFAEGNVVSASDVTDNVEDLRSLTVISSGPVSARPMLSSVSMPSVAVNQSASNVALPADSSAVPIADDDEDEGEAPLPNAEAGPTEVAYSCVRAGTVSLSDLKRQIERDCIARALAETKGNITRAAALLGMKRPRLSQLVKQYGLSAVSEGSS